MRKNQSIIMVLLIPFLLNLLVFFANLPTSEETRTSFKFSVEEVMEGCFEIEDHLDSEEEEPLSFYSRFAASSVLVDPLKFQTLELFPTVQTKVPPTSLGWYLPLLS